MEPLIEQYAEMARLAGGLAHEIRNPLSTIRLNLDLLAEDLEDLEASPVQRRAVKKIDVVRRESARLEELLGDFLQFVRGNKLEKRPSDINRQISEVIDFFRPRADDAGITIIEFLGGDLPALMLDRKSFHFVFLNLLINALQAIKGHGEIVVRTRTIGDDIAIDLIDTGDGMDDTTLSHIFEPFYSTKREGSGLGLPLAKRIIEAHGGHILVRSEVGTGTQFTILFPSLARLAEE
ncbi:MAG: two-component system sensor histidine kinase NtrB [Thermoguttaceae bacterium]